MTNSYAELNTIFYFHLFITDSKGNPKTGLTVTYKIYKSNDNSIIASGTALNVGNGTYDGSYTFTEAGQYYIIYTTPSKYTDEIESIYADKEFAKQEELLRSLGLNDENKKIINPVYDANGCLTYAEVELYPSALDFVNNTNVLATYVMNATYDANARMETFGVKRTS